VPPNSQGTNDQILSKKKGNRRSPGVTREGAILAGKSGGVVNPNLVRIIQTGDSAGFLLLGKDLGHGQKRGRSDLIDMGASRFVIPPPTKNPPQKWKGPLGGREAI